MTNFPELTREDLERLLMERNAENERLRRLLRRMAGDLIDTAKVRAAVMMAGPHMSEDQAALFVEEDRFMATEALEILASPEREG